MDCEFADYRHYCVDVGDESRVKWMFAEILKTYERLDVLVNNAGAAVNAYVMVSRCAEFESVLHTNVTGTFLCCREGGLLMKRHEYGRIVNLSSVHVPLATMATSAYGASKAAVTQFSKILAKEVASFGITVNVLGLSVVGDMGMAGTLSDQAASKILNGTITRSRLSIQDVTHTLDFLISEKERHDYRPDALCRRSLIR